MKITIKAFGIIAALAASSAIAEDFPLEEQKQRCASEWSDDFSMQKYCLDLAPHCGAFSISKPCFIGGE